MNDYNCLHFKYPILLGISEPAYDKKELAELKEADRQTFEYEGRQYTKYEASQVQRQLETAIRTEKDRSVMAKAAGKDEIRQDAQKRINLLASKYADFSKASGLPTRVERLQVKGFRGVKVKDDLTQTENRRILKEKIEKGEIKLDINPEKQGRHIKNDPLYVVGRSYLIISINEVESVVKNLHGTGRIQVTKNGQIREVINCGKVIGYTIDRDGIEYATNLAKIHYSKTGTHIVPKRGAR